MGQNEHDRLFGVLDPQHDLHQGWQCLQADVPLAASTGCSLEQANTQTRQIVSAMGLQEEHFDDIYIRPGIPGPHKTFSIFRKIKGQTPPP